MGLMMAVVSQAHAHEHRTHNTKTLRSLERTRLRAAIKHTAHQSRRTNKSAQTKTQPSRSASAPFFLLCLRAYVCMRACLCEGDSCVHAR